MPLLLKEGARHLADVIHLQFTRQEQELPIYEREAVRVIAQKIVDPDISLAGLIPTAEHIKLARDMWPNPNHPLWSKFVSRPEQVKSVKHHLNIDSFILTTMLPLSDRCLTANYWVVKAPHANCPNQVMQPGGEIIKDYGRLETVVQAAIRELGEELHQYGLSEEMLEDCGVRNFSFDQLTHPKGPRRVNSTEKLLRTEVSPFLEARCFNPEDKLLRAVALTPDKLEYFFREEELPTELASSRREKLVDSLSRYEDRRQPARVVVKNEEVERTKAESLRHAYIFEAQVRMQTVRNLLRITKHHGKTRFKDGWSEICKKYQAGIDTIVQAKDFFDDYARFLHAFEKNLQGNMSLLRQFDQTHSVFSLGIEQRKLIQRMHIVEEFDQALRATILEHNLPFMETQYEQRPFLAAMILLKTGNLGIWEYNKMQAVCPEVTAVFDTICAAFGIDISSNPEWYPQMMQNLKEYRDNKLDKIQHRTSPEIERTVDKTEKDFRTGYARRMGIRADDLSYWVAQVNEFHRSLEPTFSKIAGSSEVVSGLMPDLQATGTADISEIFLRMFGFDQYRKDSKPLSAEQRYQAWVKALMIKVAFEADQIYTQKLNTYTRVSRTVFAQMVKDASPEQTIQSITPEFSLHRYKLDLPVTGNIPILQGYTDVLDLTRLSFYILSGIRDKDFWSYIRKALERGSDISDFFGRMIVMDSDSLMEEARRFIPKHLSRRIKEQDLIALRDRCAREAIKAIADYYRKTMDEWKYPFVTRKERASRLLQGVYEELGMQLGDPNYRGSGASGVGWSWLKYVLKYTDNQDVKSVEVEEEIQIFPSIKDAQRKKEDDEGYFLRRLFVPHKSNRPEMGNCAYYPLSLILYGIQQAYEEIMEQVHRKGVLVYQNS